MLLFAANSMSTRMNRTCSARCRGRAKLHRAEASLAPMALIATVRSLCRKSQEDKAADRNNHSRCSRGWREIHLCLFCRSVNFDSCAVCPRIVPSSCREEFPLPQRRVGARAMANVFNQTAQSLAGRSVAVLILAVMFVALGAASRPPAKGDPNVIRARVRGTTSRLSAFADTLSRFRHMGTSSDSWMWWPNCID